MYNRRILYKNRRQKIFTFGGILLASLSGILVFLVNAFAFTEPVKSVNITSANADYVTNQAGSWSIDKSADWTALHKARVTFEVNSSTEPPLGYKDIIIVLDNSGSMEGERLSAAKSNINSFLTDFLEDESNKAALITFNSSASILSDFTNNVETLTNVTYFVSADGGTNYYQALLKAEDLMAGYEYQENREPVILFLTDGYPSEQTPNEIAVYQRLKQNYPYLTVAGIQYEMAETFLEPIIRISDAQFSANKDTLYNVLFEAVLLSYNYETFVLTDYVDNDYWDISGVNAISASLGTVSLEYEDSVPKITWDMSGEYRLGTTEKLTIDLTLKDEYQAIQGLYPTNKRESVQTSIVNTPDENINSDLTPILKNIYEVSYQGNAPSGCTVTGVPEATKYSVLEVVGISDIELSCPGYNFKGWEIAYPAHGVTKMNDDYFKMPESDVIIRGVWTQVSMGKSMDGTIAVAKTIYNAVAKKTLGVDSDLGITFNKNTYPSGVYTLAAHADDDYPVYYYHGDVSDNYVLFAGYCWKVVRTTTTGGTKIVYDGVPDANGACTATGTAAQISTSAFGTSFDSPAYNGYMYGTVYSRSSTLTTYANSFSSSTTMLSASSLDTSFYFADSVTYDSSTRKYSLDNPYTVSSIDDSLVGKYTFRNNSVTYTNSSVYYIAAVNGTTMYYIQLSNGNALSNVDTEYVFGDSLTDNSDGTFTLNNPVTVKKSEWYTNYATYKNYYTCLSTSATCSTLRYVTTTSGTNVTYISSDNIVLGKSRNGLELQDTITVRKDVLTQNYADYSDYKYTCNNTSATCTESNLRMILSFTSTGYTYVNNHYYGSSVTWDGSSYTLNDPIDMENYNNLDALSTHHYMCTTNGAKTCTTVAYIYYYTGSGTAHYITLKTGTETVDEALEQMQTNTTDSKIKTAVDDWYAANLTEYTDALEDTVYCNDRSMNTNTNGWIADGGKINEDLHYGAYGRNTQTYTPSVDCVNKNDAFTVDDTVNGNGALTYPVGILTADEMTLAGASWSGYYTNYYLKTDQNVWSGSPNYFSANDAFGFIERSIGRLSNDRVDFSFGVRPLVSIAPETFIIDGEGTQDDPWVLESS